MELIDHVYYSNEKLRFLAHGAWCPEEGLYLVLCAGVLNYVRD